MILIGICISIWQMEYISQRESMRTAMKKGSTAYHLMPPPFSFRFGMLFRIVINIVIFIGLSFQKSYQEYSEFKL